MTDAVLISEQFVQISGGTLFVKTWTPNNPSKNPPLILLHDSLGCVEMWRDFPQALCTQTGRKIIAYDRLGFGRSSAREALPSPRFVSEEAEIYLPALLKSLNIQRFALFGHSVGGAMAVVSAGALAGQCEAVITESAQAFVEDRTREGISKAKGDFADPKIFAKLEKYHGAKTRWVLDAWIEVWLSDAFADWSLKADLPKMKCPALVIHGDQDEYGSVRFPDMICQYAGGRTEKQVLQNFGHVPHRESPELTLQLVKEFLR